MDNSRNHQKVERIKNVLAIGFGILLILSILAWVVGVLTMVVVPLFGGIRADKIGAIGITVAGFGELSAYFFGWFLRKK